MKQTPLSEKHRALGAKMVNYAGFEMPVQYTGLIEEHLLVRTKVGLFDLSHMGEFQVSGPGAQDTVSLVTTNDPAQLEVGEIQYTFLTNEQGGIIDDILVYRTEDGFFLVVNAANTAKDGEWIKKNLQPQTTFEDLTPELALIAVQGPLSAPLIEEALGLSVAGLKNYTFMQVNYGGSPTLLSRTGYTGEDGFELYFPNALAGKLWDDLSVKGEKYDAAPIGLGARDTLRLEMRMPLYGNDVGEDITPYEAGLGRFVKLDKGPFIGREALQKQKATGVERKLIAFKMRGKGIPRQGYPLLNREGEQIGTVTSGTHSPSLDQPIGMGYVLTEYAKAGTVINVQIRRRQAEAEIIKGRFLG